MWRRHMYVNYIDGFLSRHSFPNTRCRLYQLNEALNNIVMYTREYELCKVFPNMHCIVILEWASLLSGAFDFPFSYAHTLVKSSQLKVTHSIVPQWWTHALGEVKDLIKLLF